MTCNYCNANAIKIHNYIVFNYLFLALMREIIGGLCKNCAEKKK